MEKTINTVMFNDETVIITENADGKMYLIHSKHIQNILDDWTRDCNFVPANDARVFFASWNGKPISPYEYTDFESLVWYLIQTQNKILLREEIAAKFEKASEDQIDELDFFLELMDAGITLELIRKYYPESYKFEEEIKFIKDLQESNKRVVDYDILKALEDIRSLMHNTNFDQDRIILSDAIELIKDRERYRTGMKVIYEGTDACDDILCPHCRTSVARMDDYEEMRPAHCPECGTKLIYGAENPTEKTHTEYLQELDSGILKAELLSFLDDAVYDQNRPFEEQFVEFIKNDKI